MIEESETLRQTEESQLKNELMNESEGDKLTSAQDDEKHSVIRILYPNKFADGDGVVPFNSTEMPEGYNFHDVESEASHPFLINDIGSIRDALKMIIYGESHEHLDWTIWMKSKKKNQTPAKL